MSISEHDVKVMGVTVVTSGIISMAVTYYKSHPQFGFLLVAMFPVGILFWNAMIALFDKTKALLDKKDEDEGEEETEEGEETASDSSFTGIQYEINMVDLLDLIIDKLREKMYGRTTTVNADEIREIVMATYNMTRDNYITNDMIELIIDMVIYCIEIIGEVNEAEEYQPLKESSNTEEAECPPSQPDSEPVEDESRRPHLD